MALEPLIESVGGSFLFTNVPPGEYVIQAIGDNPDLPPEFTSQFLTVSEIDTAPVVLVTSTGANLTGRIVIEGHSSSQPVPYSVRPVSADFDFAPLIGRGAALEITRQGRFQISGLFGPTRFMLFGGPAGWYLKSVVITGQDATGRPFDFGRGNDLLYSDARIVISTNGATIHGRVTDGKSDPVSDYTVLVFSADRMKWFDHSRYMKFARPSQDDSFEVTGLPPGDYFVVALDSLDATTAGGEWQDPNVLENLRRLARRVTISEGDLQQIELPLTRR